MTGATSNYDRLSRWYDLLAGGKERRLALQGISRLGLQPGACVLEIGCGTGHALLALAGGVGFNGRVVGIDLSRGMLGVTKKRLVSSPFASTIAITQADALCLPFPDSGFDAVFMAFTLELFDPQHIRLALDECQRVLLPQGRLCCISLYRPEKPGKMVLGYEWTHRKVPAWIDCRPIQASQYIQAGGFHITESTLHGLWGLPVEIVIARK